MASQMMLTIVWTLLSVMWPDFGVVLCRVRRWTRSSLWIPPNSGDSMIICSFFFILTFCKSIDFKTGEISLDCLTSSIPTFKLLIQLYWAKYSEIVHSIFNKGSSSNLECCGFRQWSCCLGVFRRSWLCSSPPQSPQSWLANLGVLRKEVAFWDAEACWFKST